MNDELEVYHWLDGLGFPDLARCPTVRVATGAWSVHAPGAPQKTFLQGFLVADDGQRFEVFLPDELTTQSFRRTDATATLLAAVYHKPGDLREDQQRWWEQRRAHFDTAHEWAPYNPVHAGAFICECCLRAWACFKAGLPELASQAFACARTIHAAAEVNPPGRSLRQHVSDEIAHLLMWQAIQAFGDPTISRRELLGRFEHILDRFPLSAEVAPNQDERFGWVVGRHTQQAQEAVTLLCRMIAEDDEHARQPVRPLQELPRQEQIAELIFHLRDQNGRQTCQPGSCRVFADERGEQSPAHQLVRLGFDAVPQLIDALEDERFTRSVGFYRDYCFSHHVLRVGDCALEILEQIAGRTFWQGTYTNAAMVKDGQAAQTKQLVLAWWNELQRDQDRQHTTEPECRGE